MFDIHLVSTVSLFVFSTFALQVLVLILLLVLIFRTSCIGRWSLFAVLIGRVFSRTVDTVRYALTTRRKILLCAAVMFFSAHILCAQTRSAYFTMATAIALCIVQFIVPGNPHLACIALLNLCNIYAFRWDVLYASFVADQYRLQVFLFHQSFHALAFYFDPCGLFRLSALSVCSIQVFPSDSVSLLWRHHISICFILCLTFNSVTALVFVWWRHRWQLSSLYLIQFVPTQSIRDRLSKLLVVTVILVDIIFPWYV